MVWNTSTCPCCKRVLHQSCWKLAMKFSCQLLWPWQFSATEHSPEFSLSWQPASTCWEHNWSVQADKKRIFNCEPNSLLRQNTGVNADPFVGHMHATEFFSNNAPPSFSSPCTHIKAAYEMLPELLTFLRNAKPIERCRLQKRGGRKQNRKEEQAVFSTVAVSDSIKSFYQLRMWSQNVNPNIETRKQ